MYIKSQWNYRHINNLLIDITYLSRNKYIEVYKMIKVHFTPELVTKSEKQPRTRKQEILHTCTSNTDQINTLDCFK